MPPHIDTTTVAYLMVAAAGGMAVGIERQWSGHAQGPRARFAGIRTFTLMGLGAGLAGWMWQLGWSAAATVLLAGLAGLVVAAYVRASRSDVDGTTEVAALVVLTAGVLAGLGATELAAAIFALTALLLVEKSRLHAWVRSIDSQELRAGARFAVMAAVILPLVPAGPFGPAGTIQPRLVWALVLFFSGLSFVGYIARRMVGLHYGYALAGTLGGLVSSTSVTLTFARLSPSKRGAGLALAAGTLGANTLLLPRVLLATALLAPPLARALWPALLMPALIGMALLMRGLRDAHREAAPGAAAPDGNPLQFRAALQMAALFQLVLFGVAAARHYFGAAGVVGSAAILGLADMDALTVSMADLTSRGTSAQLTADALVVGLIANTMVKLAITLTVGRGSFRTLTAVGLTLMGLALGGSLLL
jgi:uncharacterized membrane protein (DUF4010 family)